jgi:hypothetical protein
MSTKIEKYQFAKSEFEKFGYSLLSTEFISQVSKMDTLCANGHPYKVSFDLFYKRGLRCPICSGNRPHTLESIREKFAAKGFELISQEYIKNIIPVEVKCKNDHVWRVSFNNFSKQENPQCPHCKKNDRPKIATPVPKISYQNMLRADWASPTAKAKEAAPSDSKGLKEWLTGYYPNLKSLTLYKNQEQFKYEMFISELNLAIEYIDLNANSEKNLPAYPNKTLSYQKMLVANGQRVRVITIFEDEWRERNSQVKGFLQSVLKKNTVTVGGRKCEIREVEKRAAWKFLDENHIQGRALLAIAFGLHYKDELLGLITGNKHHRQGFDDTFVLNRLVFKGGVTVAGGASKLSKRLIQYSKDNGYKTIISWSDNRWSEGNVYMALEYKMTEDLNADYSYVDGQSRQSKQSNKKKNLIQKKANGTMENTERELAITLGLYRIWDCGKKRWEISL